MEAFTPADGQWSVRYNGLEHLFQTFQEALSHADGVAISHKLVKHIHPKERSIYMKSNHSNKFTLHDMHSTGGNGRS
jgi:hypothetical protein